MCIKGCLQFILTVWLRLAGGARIVGLDELEVSVIFGVENVRFSAGTQAFPETL
jgi:hypothetical protein